MKRMLPWILIAVLTIGLIAVCIYVVNPPKHNVSNPRLSVDEVVEASSSIDGIKTNLENNEYMVSMSFVFTLDNKKSKEDFDKIKDLVIKPVILSLLTDTQADIMKTSGGRTKFLEELKGHVNEAISDGKVTYLGITDFVMVQM